MSLLLTSLALLTSIVLLYLIHNLFHLKSVPGPLLNRLTSFPRLFSVYKGRNHLDTINIHDQYGPLVRTGPNHVSVSLPSALPTIYNTLHPFPKSEFYSLYDPTGPHGRMENTFSTRSESAHRAMKRPIAAAYSLTGLLKLEYLVDQEVEIFMAKLDDKLSKSNESTNTGTRQVVIDFGQWLHWYAFDVITIITFSSSLGFMSQERDIDGIIAAIEGRQKYNSTIGQWPVLHTFLLGNQVGKWLVNHSMLRTWNSSARIVQFAAKQLNTRQQRKESIDIHNESSKQDMLDNFRFTKISGEQQMTDIDILSAASGNVFAGSDTTAITLRAIFYYLASSPKCMAKLVKEIELAELSERITFAESQTMQYLQACIKEALRLWPAVGMSLERVVPKGGVEIAGYFLPEGTVVGANPWVLGRSGMVFEDASVFRPERWIEETGEKLKEMERSFLAWGLGSRTCLGRHIAVLEIAKMVPMVLRRFVVELESEGVLEGECYFFVKQKGLRCVIRRGK